MAAPLEQMQQDMAAEDIDAAFLLKPHNVFYFGGYASVCSGIVLFPDEAPVYCTLWLDLPEAQQVCTISKITTYVYPKESLTGRMIQIAAKKKTGIRRIGVEKDFMQIRHLELLQSHFPQAEFVHISPMVDRLRAIKSDEEVAKIRHAAAIADQAIAAALAAVRPGVSELEVAAEAEYVMSKAGSLRPAFSTFVASGERTLLAHPIASPKLIAPGEPVVIDLGAIWEGYASDICRTTFAGEPSRAQADYLRLVVKAQGACAAAVKAGALAGEPWEAAHQIFSDCGVGRYLPDDIGYGVGLRQSEFYPILEKGSTTVLKQNMVVALMQTTAFSKEIGGLRVEDTFLVTQQGSERLTSHRQALYQ
jgi:Xaa-Pro aminopeptidase